MQDYQKQFLELALAKKVLRFGSFTLKSGRVSPYFFNAGSFDDGASMAVLGQCYARAILDSGVEWDMLFGPAYKGIPLATGIAIALYNLTGEAVPYAYNRKEAKDHGEGGVLVGAPLSGRVLVVDDVISAGTSIRESAGWIRDAGARLSAVSIALDRQERGQGEHSAVQEVQAELSCPVVSIINLDTLIAWLQDSGPQNVDVDAIQRYRENYGTSI